MNSKRRAELQRKLSMGAVPRPPADLADRIKADIPKYLDAETARRSFSWSTTMRVAASLILLATTALVTLRVLESDKSAATAVRSAHREKLVPAIMPLPQQSAADAATATRAETEVSLTLSEELPEPAVEAKKETAPAAAPVQIAEGGRMRREVSNEQVAVGAVGGSTFIEDAVQETRQVAEFAAPPPPPAAPVPAPAPAPLMAPPPAAEADVRARTAETITITAHAPSIVPHAQAATLSLEKSSVFGISVDPEVFQSIKTTIEHGQRPAARSVDVEALVNYFAGSPAQPPRRNVALEVEASPSPVPSKGERAILRFTVDTAQMDVDENASVPPIATDAKIDIDLNPSAIVSFRRIGDAEPVTPESALLYNTSVTGLYELELKPHLRQSDRVATVKLTYKSVTDGRQRTIQRDIRGSDLAKTWARASRRHRLATLGAVWSETLKGTNGGSEVAKKAAELATQHPKDERARELANAASATTGGGR